MAGINFKSFANLATRFHSNKILNLGSKLFQPLNIMPTNASRTSEKLSKGHRLMVDMGIIRLATAGTYHLLPLGIRSLEKFRNIVRLEMSTLHAQELRLPFLVDYNLWKKSGRSNCEFGFFKLCNRHEKEFLLSPTNEEVAADLIANIPQLSYNQLPLLIYQISTKFRDEMKPRCGLIKTKEFEMKDLYSFDSSLKDAEQTYVSVSKAYENIFEKVGVPVIKASADSGDMKGIYSHEYHIVSDLGEDNVLICNSCSTAFNADNLKIEACKNCDSNSFLNVKGIEIAHTFMLGYHYTEAMNAVFKTVSNSTAPLVMACYGLGLTRFLASALEHLSNKEELVWPKHLAPFNVVIITPKDGSKEFEVGHKLGKDLYLHLNEMPHLYDDVLLDERGKFTIGKRLQFAKQTGYPYIIILGSKITNDPPLIEVHDTRNQFVKHLPYEEVITLLSEI